jgi:hypothetical protein
LQEQTLAGDEQFASNVRQRISEQRTTESIAVLLECGLSLTEFLLKEKTPFIPAQE